MSVIPARHADRRHRSGTNLYAANGTPILTYGTRLLRLSLGLRRDFVWPFIIADVDRAIIGADFLAEFHLLPDMRRAKLIDGSTLLSVGCIIESIDIGTTAVSTIDHSSEFAKVLAEFPALTQPNRKRECGVTHSTQHFIETEGPPVTARARRLPPEKYKAAKLAFEEMLRSGDARPSKSPWASPLHVANKRGVERWRMCGDYRALNAATRADKYPVPNIQDFNITLHGAKVFTKLDITRAYFHIPMAPGDIEKTAVITPFGLFEFPFMPFGLKNAAQTFQRFMDGLLRGLPFAYVYIDDVLIASNSIEEHREHVRQVLERLSQAGLTLSAGKCVYAQSSIEFLGYNVDEAGIRPSPSRVEVITTYPKPSDVSGLRRFIGMLGFYRRCLPNIADIQRRVQAIICTNKKNDKTPLVWTEDAELAFEELKQCLKDAVMLHHPDGSLPIILSTDASSTAIGAVLSQQREDALEPLAFFSRKLSPAETRYCTYDRELLAIYAAVRHFRSYLEGREFAIYTDHKPIVFTFDQHSEKAPPRRARQLDCGCAFAN